MIKVAVLSGCSVILAAGLSEPQRWILVLTIGFIGKPSQRDIISVLAREINPP